MSGHDKIRGYSTARESSSTSKRLGFIIIMAVIVFVALSVTGNVYKKYFVASNSPAVAAESEPELPDFIITEASSDEASFDFYSLLAEEEKINAQFTTGYWLHVATFRDEIGADNLKAELILAGYDAVIQPINLGNSHWYRVVVGPSASRAVADTTKERLHKDGFDVMLITE